MSFELSPRVEELRKKLLAFMDEHIYPNEARYFAERVAAKDRWQPTTTIEELKPKARSAGLWNLFLPESEFGAGLTNYEYAPLCEVMGRSVMAPEVFNCSAPDTGNMEVLVRYGHAEQKERWLKPLLDGEFRSCFAMTEPDVASSDATNISASIVRDGDHYVVNGRKWWTSGAGDPRCKIAIFMGKTDPDRGEAQAAVDDPGADGCARREDREDAEPSSDTTMRRTATESWCSTTFACQCRTCCLAKDEVSRSRRDASARGGFTTVCAPSASPSVRWRRCAGGCAAVWPSARRWPSKGRYDGTSPTHGSRSIKRGC